MPGDPLRHLLLPPGAPVLLCPASEKVSKLRRHLRLEGPSLTSRTPLLIPSINTHIINPAFFFFCLSGLGLVLFLILKIILHIFAVAIMLSVTNDQE